MPIRKTKKLEKLLAQQPVVEQEGRMINESLVKQIRDTLKKWYPNRDDIENYDPVVELAIIANDNLADTSLRVRCNQEVAAYMYPKVKSVEIKKEVDTTLNVNIKIAGYAQADNSKVIEAEDFILEEESDGTLEGELKRQLQ